MTLTLTDVLVLFLFILIGSYITIRIYDWIVGGIITRKEEREGLKAGKLYNTASERIVKRK